MFKRGVGKTSFVNIMEYAVDFDKIFLNKYIKVDIPNLIPCYQLKNSPLKIYFFSQIFLLLVFKP